MSGLLLPRTWRIVIEGRTDQPDNPVLRAQLLAAVSLTVPLSASVVGVNVEVHDGAPGDLTALNLEKGG